MTTRLAPLEPPYDEEVAATLAAMMPPGVPPLLLFRTIAHNPRVLAKIRASNLLDRGSLERRHREIVILRTTARCGCEYEWGVHVAFFAARVGLGDAEVAATVHGGADHPAWSEAERTLIRLADELHDGARISRRAVGRAAPPLERRSARRAGRARGLLPHDLVRRERPRRAARAGRAALSGRLGPIPSGVRQSSLESIRERCGISSVLPSLVHQRRSRIALSRCAPLSQKCAMAEPFARLAGIESRRRTLSLGENPEYPQIPVERAPKPWIRIDRARFRRVCSAVLPMG